MEVCDVPLKISHGIFTLTFQLGKSGTFEGGNRGMSGQSLCSSHPWELLGFEAEVIIGEEVL